MSIKFIQPTHGPSIEERILDLIAQHPEGLSLLGMSKQLNRPVSMLNRCLKILIATKAIYRKYNPQSKKYIYYYKSCLITEPEEKMVTSSCNKSLSFLVIPSMY